MNSLDVLWLAWPFIGLGGGIAIVLYLFMSPSFSTEKGGYKDRFFNPTWIAWAVAAAYLFHVMEEYGCHIENGQYVMITRFHEMGVDVLLGGLPLAFFPYVNIGFTWAGLPISAVISKKNPVVGLSGTGFLIMNALTHIAAGLAGKMSLTENAGSITGIFLFIPLFIWAIVANNKVHFMSKKGMMIAALSGVIGHIALFLGYGVNKFVGHFAAYIFFAFVWFSGIIISSIWCKKSKVLD